MVKKS